jgi:hypothetical protein
VRCTIWSGISAPAGGGRIPDLSGSRSRRRLRTDGSRPLLERDSPTRDLAAQLGNEKRRRKETKNGEGKNHRIGHRAESVKIDYNQQRRKLEESRNATEKSNTERRNEGEKLLRSAVDTRMKTRAAQTE